MHGARQTEEKEIRPSQKWGGFFVVRGGVREWEKGRNGERGKGRVGDVDNFTIFESIAA